MHIDINTTPSAAVGAGSKLRSPATLALLDQRSQLEQRCKSLQIQVGQLEAQLSSQVGSITRAESHRCAAAARQAALEQELAECGEERRRLLKQASYCMARSEEMAVRTEEMRAEHADGMMAAGRWPLFEPTVWPSA